MVYQNFAYFYDELMSHAPYDKWIELTKNIVKEYDLINPSIVDLGCGTGEITLGLTDITKNITGVDYSSEMLSVAMNKGFEQRKQVNWIKQDIRQLEGFKNIDLIVSYCDVINYITKTTEVETVFKRVYESLKDSGVFTFDVHAQDYIKNHLINETFADVSDKTAYIWFCHEGDQPGAMEHEITFFVKNKNDTYDKITEYHFQQVFTHDFYIEALKKAGFREIKISTDFDLNKPILTAETDRVFITAKK